MTYETTQPDSSEAYFWAPPKPSRAKKAIPRRGRNHFSVFMTIGDHDGAGGYVSGCGSLGEYHTKVISLAEPDTIDVIEQVGPFPYQGPDGKTHGHFLDQLVIKADGRRLAMSDKPYANVTEDFCNELSQVRDYGVGRGLFTELFLVTEYARDPIELFNAALQRACRDADGEVDVRTLEVIDAMEEPATLGELTDRIGFGPRSFRALVRCIRPGLIVMLKKEKIDRQTMVSKILLDAEVAQ